MSRKEQARKRGVRRYEDTPSPNPRYQGATPADVGRALLRTVPARHAEEKVEPDPPRVKQSV